MAGCRTVLTIYPFANAAYIMLFLPDRQPNLGLVDDIATGIEGLTSVGGGYTNDDSNITEFQQPFPVDADGVTDTKPLDRFIDYLAAFLFCNRPIHLVLQALNRLAFVMVANPSLKHGKRPASIIADRLFGSVY